MLQKALPVLPGSVEPCAGSGDKAVASPAEVIYMFRMCMTPRRMDETGMGTFD